MQCSTESNRLSCRSESLKYIITLFYSLTLRLVILQHVFALTELMFLPSKTSTLLYYLTLRRDSVCFNWSFCRLTDYALKELMFLPSKMSLAKAYIRSRIRPRTLRKSARISSSVPGREVIVIEERGCCEINNKQRDDDWALEDMTTNTINKQQQQQRQTPTCGMGWVIKGPVILLDLFWIIRTNLISVSANSNDHMHRSI